METLFLNFIQAINDSRFWLGPLLLIVVCVMLAWEIITTVQDEVEE
jgi:hypothetical protein